MVISSAVIGLGYWGPNLVRNFRRHPSLRVDYICDMDKGRLGAVSRMYPDCTALPDYREVLRSDVELVALATPYKTHYSIARRLLEAGKHVLVEKPFTSTVREAEALIGLADKKGLRIFVNHTYVYHPVARKIRGLIKAGGLGEIFYFHSERINPLLRDDISAIWDLAPHDFSIMLFLFGGMKPSAVEVRACRCLHHSQVDFAHILTESERGPMGHVHVSWLSPFKVRRVTVGGSRRTIWWDDVGAGDRLAFTESRVRTVDKGTPPVAQTHITGDLRAVATRDAEPLYELVCGVVSSLKSGAESEVDGRSGLDVVRLLAASEESIRKGGKRIRLSWAD